MLVRGQQAVTLLKLHGLVMLLLYNAAAVQQVQWSWTRRQTTTKGSNLTPLGTMTLKQWMVAAHHATSGLIPHQTGQGTNQRKVSIT
jgi:hypothetical protein